MNTIMLTVFAILLLVLVRNQLVFRATMRRIDEIHKENSAAIDAGIDTAFGLNRYSEIPSHESMLFDLRKWTYQQFFPETK